MVILFYIVCTVVSTNANYECFGNIVFSPASKVCLNLNMPDKGNKRVSDLMPDSHRETQDCELRFREIGQSISRFRTC